MVLLPSSYPLGALLRGFSFAWFCCALQGLYIVYTMNYSSAQKQGEGFIARTLFLALVSDCDGCENEHQEDATSQ